MTASWWRSRPWSVASDLTSKTSIELCLRSNGSNASSRHSAIKPSKKVEAKKKVGAKKTAGDKTVAAVKKQVRRKSRSVDTEALALEGSMARSGERSRDFIP